MDRKWPLDIEVTAAAIRAKVDDLLARKGEWTPLWKYGLERISAEADILARIVTDMQSGLVDERDVLTDMASRLGECLTADMVEQSPNQDVVNVRNWVKRALGITAILASDIVESISRSDLDDLDRIVPGNNAEFVEKIVSQIISRWNDEKTKQIDKAASDLTSVLNKPNGKIGRTPLDDAIERKFAQGRERNLARIEAAFQATVANYGLPERLAPRLSYEDDGVVVYHWGVGLPIAGEAALKEDDPRLSMLPNGSITISYAVNSIGEMNPRELSRIAAEVQRILLIAGRDAEIDGFSVPLHQPPAYCIAAALPLARLIRHNAADDRREFEISGGIATCIQTPIGDSGLATLTSDPLLDGTTVIYSGELPEILRMALTERTNVPMREIVDHPAFDDEKIVIRRTEAHREGYMVFYLDCPVERLVPIPESYGIEQNPIEAWSDFGQRLNVEDFYEGIRLSMAKKDAGITTETVH